MKRHEKKEIGLSNGAGMKRWIRIVELSSGNIRTDRVKEYPIGILIFIYLSTIELPVRRVRKLCTPTVFARRPIRLTVFPILSLRDWRPAFVWRSFWG